MKLSAVWCSVSVFDLQLGLTGGLDEDKTVQRPSFGRLSAHPDKEPTDVLYLQQGTTERVTIWSEL